MDDNHELVTQFYDSLPYAIEVARQLHDARKALHLDDIALRWNSVYVPCPDYPKSSLYGHLRPFIAIRSVNIQYSQVFLPLRREKHCPYHREPCLPTRENTSHWLRAEQAYAGLIQQSQFFAPTFLVDLLDPWPRDVIAQPKKDVKRQALPAALRYHVLQRDNFRCQLCGASPASANAVTLHVDHKHSKAHGGSDDPANLWTLCELCNSGKNLQDV